MTFVKNQQQQQKQQTQTEVDEQFQRGCSLREVNLEQSIAIFEHIIYKTKFALLREKSIYELAELFAKNAKSAELKDLLFKVRPFFNTISKAKTGKILRRLIDKISSLSSAAAAAASAASASASSSDTVMHNDDNNINNNKKSNNDNYGMVIDMCLDCIAWCVSGKRRFLKQQIECRLCLFYLHAKKFQAALKLMVTLIRDVKKMDDKHLLVEVHLIESQIDHALSNIAKAKAALTAARAAANSIYIGPELQAEIDMHAGRLAVEERDYKTAYSYFYEAFEGFDGLQEARAPLALKYMLLSKIMNDEPSDVQSVIQGKLALKYSGIHLECMKAVAKAYSKRSLHAFESVINAPEYYDTIHSDLVVKNKLNELRDKLLEQNLLRLLEPFSRVEIAHISELISLPTNIVESKLSSMILDKKFDGILDQGSNAIIVFQEIETNNSYKNANETIDVLNSAVDALFNKSKLF